MRQSSFFDSTPKPGKLIFSLTIAGRLPSWNDILGMEQWARYQFKKELAGKFLYALQQSERASSTKIISAKNTTSICSATLLVAHLETARQLRELKSAKKKLKLASAKKSALKSMSCKKPVPF